MALAHGLPEVDLTLGPVKDASFLNEVDKGMKGLNIGLIGNLAFTKRIYGVQKGRYYLIGAHPNVGKTQFTDFTFVFSLWLKAKAEGKKIKVFYVSLEISATEKKAKWCSMYLKWKHDIDWSSDFILGRHADNLPDEDDLHFIREAYTFVELMLQDVHILDSAVTPSKLVAYLQETYYAKLGVILRSDTTAEQKKKGELGEPKQYIPHSEIPMTLLVIDHLALLVGRTMKEAMDEMSIAAVRLRNVFGLSCVFIQQFNQDLIKSKREAVVRHGGKVDVSLLAPQQMDFGDSTYTYRDADVVFGLVKPNKFDLELFADYPCGTPQNGGLGDCFLVGYLIKNRYGPLDSFYPMFMNGRSCMFYDLPDMWSSPDLSPWISQALKLIQNG